MQNDLNKKKAEFLKNIMSHPKLSRVFSDALSSPIGSTKREQSKSILSIMKKLRGIKNDGQGGPGMSYMSSPSTNPVSANTKNDYSNLIIFPAAPKFKTRTETKKQDGQGGLNDFGNFNNNNFDFNQPKTYTAPEPPQKPFAAIPPAVKKVIGAVGEVGYRTGEVLGALNPFTGKQDIVFSGLVSPFGTYKESTPSVLGKYASPQKEMTDYSLPSSIQGVTKQPVQGPQKEPVTGTTPSSTVDVQGTGAKPSITPTPTPSPQIPMTQEEKIRAQAQSAVNQGTGAGFFAQGIADAKFEGGLGAYLDKLDTKLKTDFNIDSLESSLSDMSSLKQNFVPTMENYIRGKDQYLKSVDSLLDQANDSYLKMDLGNPEVKKQADTYIAYLNTLKGRQNQSYGKLLNNAISDYNADFERMQNNYNNVYKQYNDTITRKGTIAQSEYNTLYTTMGDLYNNLQDAPTRQIQTELMKEQLIAANLANINKKIIEGASDIWGGVKEYKDEVVDSKNNLLPSDILNLPSMYQKVISAGKSPLGVTNLVAMGMATGLSNAKAEGDEKKQLTLISDYRNMINDLASVEGGLAYAKQLGATFERISNSAINSYVFNNVDNFKQSLDSLVRNSYLSKNDKDGWLDANSTLDKKILGDVYDAVKMSQNQSEVYSKNPSLLFTKDEQGNNVYKKISDVPNEIISKNISTRLSKMWEAEIGIISASSSK